MSIFENGECISRSNSTGVNFIVNHRCVLMYLVAVFILVSSCSDEQINAVQDIGVIDTTSQKPETVPPVVVPDSQSETPLRVEYSTLTDSRDGHVYRYVVIDSFAVMENLNYSGGSMKIGLCAFANDCIGIGRLYGWAEAMKSDTTLLAQGICPVGWHLPSVNEFSSIVSKIRGAKLFAYAKDWKYEFLNAATDSLNSGLRIKPSGFYSVEIGNRFSSLDSNAFYWTSQMKNADNAYYLHFGIGDGSSFTELKPAWYDKKTKFSVRCVRRS